MQSDDVDDNDDNNHDGKVKIKIQTKESRSKEEYNVCKVGIYFKRCEFIHQCLMIVFMNPRPVINILCHLRLIFSKMGWICE